MTKCSFLFEIDIAPIHVCTNKVRGAASDDRVPLVEAALPEEFFSIGDRVRAGGMTADDVVSVEGLYRPGLWLGCFAWIITPR
jgi:hypothetical protein